MSIVSCYQGFKIQNIVISKYIEVIRRCIPDNGKLGIHFKGLTTSNSCLLLQGFTDSNFLKQIRNNLRIEFNKTELEQTIDKRYTIQTAHSTVVRFRKPFTNLPRFLERIEKCAELDFGAFKVEKLELVHNDWYQRKKYVKKLYEFEI
jgi:2'-5' RNA ligase